MRDRAVAVARAIDQRAQRQGAQRYGLGVEPSRREQVKVSAQVLLAHQRRQDQRIFPVAQQGRIGHHRILHAEGQMLLQGKGNRLLELATVAEGESEQAFGYQLAGQSRNHDVRDAGLRQQPDERRRQVGFVLGPLRLVGPQQGKGTPRTLGERGPDPIIGKFQRENPLRHPS